eukprot:SAG11_NODE_2452_length_3345_cov_3.549908_4_plen_95_part_00
MNILDLNDDIMSKVKHESDMFLRKIKKHKEDNFNYEGFDWEEFDNRFDFISLENGVWAFCATPEALGYEDYTHSDLLLCATGGSSFLGMIKNLL